MHAAVSGYGTVHIFYAGRLPVHVCTRLHIGMTIQSHKYWNHYHVCKYRVENGTCWLVFSLDCLIIV